MRQMNITVVSPNRTCLFASLLLVWASMLGSSVAAAEGTAAAKGVATKASDLPLVVHEQFSNSADRWKPTDAAAWKLIPADSGHVYSLRKRKGDYKPPHRSPFTFALFDEATLGDFDVEVKARSTVKEYAHRDVCLIFGYQDPAHFYYVHFASKADPHANQIFIVNGADRQKITVQESKGVKWTDDWHTLKIVRRPSDGTIEAYFDDMEKPIMTASDKTFTTGKLGIGSFDDTADFAEVVLHGTIVEPSRKKAP